MKDCSYFLLNSNENKGGYDTGLADSAQLPWKKQSS